MLRLVRHKNRRNGEGGTGERRVKAKNGFILARGKSESGIERNGGDMEAKEKKIQKKYIKYPFVYIIVVSVDPRVGFGLRGIFRE